MVEALRAHALDTRYLVLCSDDVHPNLLQEKAISITGSAWPWPRGSTRSRPSRWPRSTRRSSCAWIAIWAVAPDTWPTSSCSRTSRRSPRPRFCTTARSWRRAAGWSRSRASSPTRRGPGQCDLSAPVSAADLAVRTRRRGSAQGRRPSAVVAFGGPKTMHTADLSVVDGVVQPSAAADVASIAVIERHRCSRAIGRVSSAAWGSAEGAAACTVNHDSHNLFVIGDSFNSMADRSERGGRRPRGATASSSGPRSARWWRCRSPACSPTDRWPRWRRLGPDRTGSRRRVGLHRPVPADLRPQLPLSPEHPRRRCDRQGIIETATMGAPTTIVQSRLTCQDRCVRLGRRTATGPEALPSEASRSRSKPAESGDECPVRPAWPAHRNAPDALPSEASRSQSKRSGGWRRREGGGRRHRPGASGLAGAPQRHPRYCRAKRVGASRSAAEDGDEETAEDGDEETAEDGDEESVQSRVEEVDHLGPDPLGLGLVTSAQRVVGRHERMTGAGVDGHGHVLAHRLQLRAECLAGVGREEVVVLGQVGPRPWPRRSTSRAPCRPAGSRRRGRSPGPGPGGWRRSATTASRPCRTRPRRCRCRGRPRGRPGSPPLRSCPSRRGPAACSA